MSQRSFEAVLLVGNICLAREIAVAAYVQQHHIFEKWAIAGPDYRQITEVLTRLSEPTVCSSYNNSNNIRESSVKPNVVPPDIVIVDPTDAWALRDICSETWILLNFASQSLSEAIIETCIETRCNYMDLCNDLQELEAHVLKYQVDASRKGVCIVHGCAFESAVAELGVALAIGICEPQSCNSVESFLAIDGVAHQSKPAVDALLAQQKNRKNIRKMQSDMMTKFKLPTRKHPGPSVELKSPYYFDTRLQQFASPSATCDTALVDHALRSITLHHHEKILPQFHAYLLSDSKQHANSNSFYSSLFSSMGKYSMGRSIVRRLPEALTDGHQIIRPLPSEDELRASSFTMTFVARGFVHPWQRDAEEESDDECQEGDSDELGELPEAQIVTADAVPMPTTLTRDMVCKTSTAGLPCSAFFFNIAGSAAGGSANKTALTSSSNSTASSAGCSSAAYCPTSSIQDVSHLVPFEKWIVVRGPEPHWTTTTILLARLAQFFLKMRYRQGDESVLSPIVANVHKADGFGGVYTPGSLFFRNPFVYDTLADAGITFEIVTPFAQSDLLVSAIHRSAAQRLNKSSAADPQDKSVSSVPIRCSSVATPLLSKTIDSSTEAEPTTDIKTSVA